MPQYSINIADSFDKVLTDASKQQGTTKADIIRKAVASYVYLTKETTADTGRKVSITDDNNRVIKDVMLP